MVIRPVQGVAEVWYDDRPWKSAASIDVAILADSLRVPLFPDLTKAAGDKHA